MKENISMFSPAKINLFLEIKNKDRDGLHNLQSLMSFCDFGDLIYVSKSKDLSLEINGPFSRSLIRKDNIILRTIYMLEKYLNTKIKVNIRLNKNLPIASGMGGGSSNAATIIHCIKQLFKINFDKNFNDFLFNLGADVPFCFYRRVAMVEGKGEKITFYPRKIPEYFVLLVNPNIQISTKRIFQKLKINFRTKKKPENRFVLEEDFLSYLLKKNNDLEVPAIDQCDEIKFIINELNNNTESLLSRMTGSGATCFALYDKRVKLLEAEKKIKEIKENYWVKTTKLVNII